jgi:hypothetical protein
MIFIHVIKNNGGYGDILIGIGACIAVAIALKHDYKILWDHSLEHVFIDFVKFNKHKHKFNVEYNWIDERSKTKQILHSFNPKEWKHKIIKISSNQPIHQYLFQNSNRKLQRQLVKLGGFNGLTSLAYRQIYTNHLILRNPPQMLKHEVGIQIRFGDNVLTGDQNCKFLDLSQASQIFQKLKVFITESNMKSIYLTTDYQPAVLLFSQIHGMSPKQLMTKPVHFLQANSNELEQIIHDHYLLSQCQQIITSRTSNFGLTAGFINSSGTNVILYNSKGELQICKHNCFKQEIKIK